MIYVHYTKNAGCEGGLIKCLSWPMAIFIALTAKREGFDKVVFK